MTKMIFGPLRTAHYRSDRLLRTMTGLGTSDLTILAFIEEQPKANQSEIARLSATDDASCGKILSNFKEKGWIEIGKVDGRTNHVTITATGIAKLSEARVSAFAVEQGVIAELGENLLPKAIQVLDAISRKTQKALEECR